MKSTWRRYEVLLPVEFNDGSPVPAEVLGEVQLEVVEQFGASQPMGKAFGSTPALFTETI